jgi:signal transduction histidine kinase
LLQLPAIRIQDDGIGINPDTHILAANGHGTDVAKQGLTNMKARAHSIGGQITIESQKNCGTEIQMSFNKEVGGKNEGKS